MRWHWLAALTMAGSACSYAVSDVGPPPEHPTYAAHIRPFMTDHCLVCHSSPPDRGAPAYFRLDVYADENNVLGAGSMASVIKAEVVDGKPRIMPPGDGVGPNGKQLIANWVADGAPP